MDREQLQKFIQTATGDLASLRSALLVTAQTGDTSNLDGAIRNLERTQSGAAACGQQSVAELTESCGWQIAQVAEAEHCPPKVAFDLLDHVSRIEAAVFGIPLGSEEFTPEASELVDTYFDELTHTSEGKAEDAVDDFEIDDETMEIFRTEADDLLANIGNALDVLELSPQDPTAIWDVRRHSHTFKGAAGIVGLRSACDVAHRMEDLLDGMVEQRLEPGPEVVKFLQASARRLGTIIASRDTAEDGIDLDALYQNAQNSVGSKTAEAPQAKSDSVSTAAKADIKAPADGGTPTAERPTRSFSTPIVRVSLERLDEIIQVTQTLLSNQKAVADCQAAIGTSDNTQTIARLASLLETQKHLTAEIHAQLLQVRMVRFGTLETRLSRAVHATCTDENKKAVVEIENGQVEIDTQVIDALIEPLLHLLKNAVVHGIEPPDTRRLIGKPASGTICVRLDADDQGLILSVSDDGAGISISKLRARALAGGVLTAEAARNIDDREAIDLIFDRGLTTADRIDLNAGRGVGMCIVRESVESHGGTVVVETEPQKGTTFTIVMPLPLVKAARREAAIPRPVEELAVPELPDLPVSPLVMIVDDSASIRKHSTKLVEQAGYRTINAVNGADALEILLSGRFEPDLILSDVEMPQMDGWEFLEYVKTDDNFGHIPVVMVTSLKADEYRERAQQLGASNYLVKPYSTDELSEILDQHLTALAA